MREHTTLQVIMSGSLQPKYLSSYHFFSVKVPVPKGRPSKFVLLRLRGDSQERAMHDPRETLPEFPPT